MSTQTIGALEQAAESLKAVDLRTLRGPARDDVRNARTAVDTALKSTKALQKQLAGV